MDPNATLTIANDKAASTEERLAAIRNLANWLGRRGFVPEGNLSLATLALAGKHGHDLVANHVFGLITKGN